MCVSTGYSAVWVYAIDAQPFLHRSTTSRYNADVLTVFQEKVAQAAELAERHFYDFKVSTLTRNERNQFLAALGIKLPLSCAFLDLCLIARIARIAHSCTITESDPATSWYLNPQPGALLSLLHQ